MAEPPENVLYGRNPVREALKSGRSVERLLVASGLKNEGSVREIVGIAVENHVPVIEVPRERLDLLCAGAHHQGVALYAAMKDYVPMEDILAVAAERGEDAFVLVLDGIEDPQNVGAMLRVAECAGVHGVIVQKRRAAGLTPATMRAASGAGEYIPVCQVTNLRAALESLKQAGLWVMGADMDGECCYDASLTGPIALVIGAEGNGLSALTARTCDKLIRLPMRGRVGSLNASAAASALVYEIVRQRGWR
nr:23S rRNA (guanosine(2251)-2'-O)-methyltransferase RlmB [bacterium]